MCAGVQTQIIISNFKITLEYFNIIHLQDRLKFGGYTVRYLDQLTAAFLP